MELQKIVVLCIVLAVVGAGTWYITQDRGAEESTTQIDPPSQQLDAGAEDAGTENTTFAGSGSFFELMRLGRSVTCEYTYADADGNSGSGVGYFSGGNMRIDAETTVDGEVFTSNMISDGETLYMWSTEGQETFAIMMAAPEGEAAVSGSQTYETQSERQVDLDQEVEYDCDPWRTDSSMFVPPADVEFMDMQAMMEASMQGMPEGFTMPEGFPAQ